MNWIGRVYKLFLIPAVFVIVIIVRLLRPILLIRFGQLDSSRIGHFASYAEIYLCERDVGIHKKSSYDIFYCTEPISNRQLKKMWQRILHISPFPNLIRLMIRLNRWFRGYEKHLVTIKEHRDLYGFYMHTPAHLSFTDEEEYQGQQALRELGISQEKPFVCFHARDSVYLENENKSYDWTYHGYRNCNVQSYISAAEELVRRGYFVIRMGAKIKEPLVTSNQMILDYATKYRTDFLDIYLSAKCHFFIGSGSGIDEVPKIFRHPVVYINFIPLDYVEVLNSTRLFIPKKLWLRKERRFLAFREILDSAIGKFFYSKDYVESGIDIIDNTPEEIMDAVVEMDERLKGTWQTSEEDEELQRSFWSLFKLSELRAGITSRIGAKFLKQNRELLN